MKNFLTDIIAMYAIAITVLFFIKSQDNKELQYNLRDYAIVNEKYVPMKAVSKEIKKINYYANNEIVPPLLIKAIGTHEQGLGTHLFGVKRIADYIAWTKPVSEWQVAMCVRIVKEEMYKYADINHRFFKDDLELLAWINKNKKAFTRFLAKRYCYKDRKNWAARVYRYWIKYKKEAKQ